MYNVHVQVVYIIISGAGSQLWELASGRLKLTLTGHISSVRALTVSPRQPYLFSAGEDKQVKCWDLEYNKVRISGYDLYLYTNFILFFSSSPQSSVPHLPRLLSLLPPSPLSFILFLDPCFLCLPLPFNSLSSSSLSRVLIHTLLSIISFLHSGSASLPWAPQWCVLHVPASHYWCVADWREGFYCSCVGHAD